MSPVPQTLDGPAAGTRRQPRRRGGLIALVVCGHRSASLRASAIALGCEVGRRHGAPTCCPSAFGGPAAPREAPLWK
ncbi:hypothetical protein EMIHUDRAFT_368497, partial [Emiliania huxleyi CCMP1516]|uniref:Uncharacterized protein n=2 Tax=Emiliania huxleyi TaxID=2903 RepID=A0A0D3JET5_EMIH1